MGIKPKELHFLETPPKDMSSLRKKKKEFKSGVTKNLHIPTFLPQGGTVAGLKPWVFLKNSSYLQWKRDPIVLIF